MDIIAGIYLYVMIIGSFIVGIANFIDILKNSSKKRRFSDVGWAKWAYIILGFYWSIAYTVLLFMPEGKEYAFTSIFIRPSMVVLIFLLLLANRKPVYLPDLIREAILKLKIKKGEKKYGEY